MHPFGRAGCVDQRKAIGFGIGISAKCGGDARVIGCIAPADPIAVPAIARGQALMKALRGRLSGLAQPTYVLDVPGGHGKVPIGSSYLGDDPDALTIEDAFGAEHPYPG